MTKRNELGRYIREVRIKRHILTKDLAKAVNKSSAYICDIEKGRRAFNPDQLNQLLLVKIAEYLDVPITTMFLKAGLISGDTEETSKMKKYLSITKDKTKAGRIAGLFEGLREDLEALKGLLQQVPGPRKIVEKCLLRLTEVDSEIQFKS